MKLTVIYRISNNSYDKKRLPHATKEHCLRNFVKNFLTPHSMVNQHCSFVILKDGCDETTSEMVNQIVAQHIVYGHGMPNAQVKEVQGGSSAQSFNRALDFALNLPEDEHVYFVEDDYLHLPGSRMILEEGLERAHYVSLYDHLDKYVDDGGNPYVDDGGEITRVYKTKTCHWKLTNSTTMTFATSVPILRADESVWREHTKGQYPRDFDAFIALRNIGRTVATPIPGYSTHAEIAWLSPFTDWSKV